MVNDKTTKDLETEVNIICLLIGFIVGICIGIGSASVWYGVGTGFFTFIILLVLNSIEDKLIEILKKL